MSSRQIVADGFDPDWCRVGDLITARHIIGAISQRLTYYLDSQRHVITLTAFVKQRQNERREVERARRAMQSRKETRR